MSLHSNPTKTVLSSKPIQTLSHTDTHTNTHIQTNKHTHTHTHTYIQTDAHTLTNTHKHTHTQTNTNSKHQTCTTTGGRQNLTDKVVNIRALGPTDAKINKQTKHITM